MTLRAGTKLGPYEILAPLGAGSMGEVYRARDTKLSRVVAIKALPEAFAQDAERLARFQREAQLLASLNHPNIGAIHGLQEGLSASPGQAGAAYLVLEFVDGTPLDVMLRKAGAMPAANALPIARQIADAIAAAHEKGIIHRDLKPGNVMVTTDGQVKVLDFGLGKAIGEDSSNPASQSNSPTMTIGGTQAGIVLGTAGYMSPEQAKGRPADKRSDVWSFGCLLYEMLAGARAFQGEDVTDTIAAVVRGEPDWKALPAATPPALRRLIERCLTKDRAQRLPDMSVVRYVLNEPSASDARPALAIVRSGPTRSATPWMVATAVSVLTAIGLSLGYLGARSRGTAWQTTTSLARFTIVLQDGHEVVQTQLSPLAISPQETALVYPARAGGKAQLFIYDFAIGETKVLEGTDGGYSPFFSPDGRWIGFFANGQLKKITIGGTSLQDLAAVGQSRGGSWSTDNIIYYAPSNTSGLWKVPASGGEATEITKLDPNASEISHRNPYALPGGTALLFLVWTGPGSDEHRVEYLSLADGRRQVVVPNADGPASVVNGHIVYSGRNDAMLSAPWDPSRPSLQGIEPTVLPFLAAMYAEGAAAYAATAHGTFVHLMGGARRHLARVVWVDKSGHTEPLTVPERDYVSTTISPDGTRAAIQSRGTIEEIWIYDFRTNTFTPFVTGTGSSQAPLWTNDSKFLIYRGTRKGTRNLYRKAVDGSDAEERLTTKPGVTQTPLAMAPDGKWMLFNETGKTAGGGNDIWKVALDGAHDTAPVLATPADELAGQISPDGRWMSFDSDVSGRMQIWVQPYEQGRGQRAEGQAGMRQVSHDGGETSRWSRTGQELYYMVPDGVMAVSVSGDTFSTPRLLFRGRYRPPSNRNTNYDVARDGRFLLVEPIQSSPPVTRIEVVLRGLQR